MSKKKKPGGFYGKGKSGQPPKKSGRVILSIEVFFHNDQPDGLGFGFILKSGDDSERWQQALERSLKEWPDEHEVFLEQLAELRAQKARGEPFTEDDRAATVFNVHWLEQKGYIKPDNFTGIQIVWGGEADYANADELAKTVKKLQRRFLS